MPDRTKTKITKTTGEKMYKEIKRTDHRNHAVLFAAQRTPEGRNSPSKSATMVETQEPVSI